MQNNFKKIKMSIINYCQANNFFPVGPMANLLVEKFCMCPAVGPILDSIGSHSSIFVELGDFPHHRITFSQLDNEVSIQIPEKNLKTTEALSNLAFEIFNAQGLKHAQDLYDEAEKGDMGMEKFSLKMELQEFTSKERCDKLIKDCQLFFKIKPEPGIPDLDVQLWNVEINCHRDKIRGRWIERFQQIYCKKHPKDSKSCKVKQTDLCDLYVMHNLPLEEQRKIQTRRICERLPQASSKIKEWYKGKDDMCRQILKDEI